MIMRSILATVAITLAMVLIGGGVFGYFGADYLAATAPHWRITEWILETARVRSIKAHATGITAPAGLDDPARIPMGVDHFAAHCVVCHGAPGVPKGDIADGLYPPPPDLAVTARRYSDGELFWIIKHGIKMTGMPAWADHSDQEVWATVAFLQKLPGMSEEDYARLVMASIARGGHVHPDGTDHDDARPGPAGASQPQP